MDEGAPRAALAAIGAVAVTADTGDDAAAAAWVLPDDLDDTVVAGPPPITLLPSLDPTIMGWKLRTWYLGPHRAPLFDRSGNAGPTVWIGGQAVGGGASGATGRSPTGCWRTSRPGTSGASMQRSDGCGTGWTGCG